MALLATPAALPAQPGAMSEIDPARVIEAADTCRRAPADYQHALRHAREQGFGDLPLEVRARMPYTTLTRQDVRLILIPTTTIIPGSCKVYGNVGEAPRFDDLVARLAAALGEAPISRERGGAGWWFEDRTIHASLDEGRFDIDVIFHHVPRADMVERAARNAATAPSSPPGTDESSVDPALAIQRSLACRDAPLAIEEARRYLVEHGWPDVTRPPLAGPNTSYQFDRDGVWLVVRPFNAALAQCQINAKVSGKTVWADLLPLLTAAFGRAPDSTENNRARWDGVAGRKVEVSLVDRRWFNVVYKPANAEPTPDPTALTAASTAPSAGADEIAAAATACFGAVGGRGIDAAAIRSAGWDKASERGGTRIFSRDGSNVRIFAARGGQCVVDAYGQRRDSFDAIRDAVRGRLSQRFGGKLALGSATGHARSPSRGQGFTVGKRIGVLSSEQRDDGLSIRFTVMTIN